MKPFVLYCQCEAYSTEAISNILSVIELSEQRIASLNCVLLAIIKDVRLRIKGYNKLLELIALQMRLIVVNDLVYLSKNIKYG